MSKSTSPATPDPRLRRPLVLLRAAARVAGISSVSAGLLASYTVTASLSERYLRLRGQAPRPELAREPHVHLWAQAQRRLLGVQIVTQPAPRPRPAGPQLVVSNHRSALDIVVMLELFGGSLLSRADLAAWPALGALARAAGTLFVDRDDSHSRISAIRKVRARLLSGATVVVFPEGTTFPGDEVRPFQPGAFMGIAHAAGHVVPVGLAYQDDAALFGEESFPEHLSRLLQLRQTRVGVAVGDPLPAAGASAKSLAQSAHREVQRLVESARELVRGRAASR